MRSFRVCKAREVGSSSSAVYDECAVVAHLLVAHLGILEAEYIGRLTRDQRRQRAWVL